MLTKTTWDRLADRPGQGAACCAASLIPQSPFNVFAALDQVDGHRFLLLKSSQSNVRPASLCPRAGDSMSSS